jgi:gamma-glutamyltranspeptidase / glutathione hydrolase
MRSPNGLDTADYPLDGSGKASDLFPWPAVKDDRNVQGATAIAVPGTVAGMELAHQHYGTFEWRELLAPAVELARKGMLVDWYASLLIASTARELAKDADAAAMFLEDGQWPIIAGWTALSEQRLDQSRMADTLARLAEAGARDFYEGDIAASLAADIQAKGGSLSRDDLAAYRARLTPTIAVPYRGGTVHAPEGLTAGGNLAECLAMMEEAFTPGAAPDGKSFSEMARALGKTYRRRLAEMGDRDAPHAPSCTTHFSVVDRKGNMCAVTQTLLSIFGSRVVSPSTGLLMNNGIMWFDPEPGKPNSLAPDKGCLMNVCPTIGEKDGRRFAIGASGGRKILPAVLNLTSFMMDFGMSLEDARCIIKMCRQPLSLDQPVGDHEDNFFGEFLEEDREDDPLYDANMEMLKARLEDVMVELTHREREIIRLRYGLTDGYTYTLEEVGKIFQVTRERVRQIESKAVRKLQQPYRTKALVGFLDGAEAHDAQEP